MAPPTKAWFKSLPTVIAGPMVAWLLISASAPLWDGTGATISSFLGLGLVAGIFGGVVHAISYAAIGLPLFHHAYPNSASPIWSVGISSAIGICLGLLAFLIFQLGIRGGSLNYMNPIIVITGPLYGLWTALCARRYRPANSEQGAS